MAFLNAWKNLYYIEIAITLHSGLRLLSLERDVRSDGQTVITRLVKLSLTKKTLLLIIILQFVEITRRHKKDLISETNINRSGEK